MRTSPGVLLLATLAMGCRTYQSYGRVADQGGLIPAERFARYGREQASVIAIGRSIAAWRMTSDPADQERQLAQAKCFAERLPEVKNVVPDPQGHRLTVEFRSGWRAGVVPVPDGVDPAATPGIGTLLPPSSACR